MVRDRLSKVSLKLEGATVFEKRNTDFLLSLGSTSQFFVLLFLGRELQQMEAPGPGIESELPLQPTPQLQQRRIPKPMQGARDGTPAPRETMLDFVKYGHICSYFMAVRVSVHEGTEESFHT